MFHTLCFGLQAFTSKMYVQAGRCSLCPTPPQQPLQRSPFEPAASAASLTASAATRDSTAPLSVNSFAWALEVRACTRKCEHLRSNLQALLLCYTLCECQTASSAAEQALLLSAHSRQRQTDSILFFQHTYQVQTALCSPCASRRAQRPGRRRRPARRSRRQWPPAAARRLRAGERDG